MNIKFYVFLTNINHARKTAVERPAGCRRPAPRDLDTGGLDTGGLDTGASGTAGLDTGGSGGRGADVALRREFAGVEIDRTGDHHPFYWDYQDIAPLDALIPTASCAPAVAEAALEVATVAPRPTASASRACPRRTAIPAPTGPGSAPPAATRAFP